MRCLAAVVSGILASAALAPAQVTGSVRLDALLGRLDAYVEAYETELSALVAEERYVQREIGDTLPQSASGRSGIFIDPIRERTMESDVAFVRLPGGGEWYGYRDTFKVDKRMVKDGRTLLDLLAHAGADVVAQAGAIARASSSHNLGLPRTINMPTVPLELLHPRHRARFDYALGPAATVGQARTVKVHFVERGAPTLVKGSTGEDLMTSGAAWVEADSGRVWRVEVVIGASEGASGTQASVVPSVRVDFGRDDKLGMLVPVEMREVFVTQKGHGEGKATYSRYRRFQTAARIVPP